MHKATYIFNLLAWVCQCENILAVFFNRKEMLLNGNGHKQTSNDLPKLEEKEPGSFLLNCHYIQIKPLCRQHVLSLPDWMVASPKACQPELTPDFGNRQMAWTTKANTWSLSRTWTYCACTCSQLRSWCTPHSTVAKNEDQCTASTHTACNFAKAQLRRQVQQDYLMQQSCGQPTLLMLYKYNAQTMV